MTITIDTHDDQPEDTRALWTARSLLQEASKVLGHDEPRHHTLERRKIANAIGEVEDSLGIGGK